MQGEVRMPPPSLGMPLPPLQKEMPITNQERSGTRKSKMHQEWEAAAVQSETTARSRAGGEPGKEVRKCNRRKERRPEGGPCENLLHC